MNEACSFIYVLDTSTILSRSVNWLFVKTVRTDKRSSGAEVELNSKFRVQAFSSTDTANLFCNIKCQQTFL